MARVTELILRDVRCFQDLQRARVRPITLLVGENSTGKTSFLASYYAFRRMLRAPFGAAHPDFNIEPFSMGSFRDIVRSRLGPKGLLDTFQIGIQVTRDQAQSRYDVLATFDEQSSQPRLASLVYSVENTGQLSLRSDLNGRTRVSVGNDEVTLPEPMDILSLARQISYGIRDLPSTLPDMERLVQFLESRSQKGSRSPTSKLLFPDLPRLAAIAPLRAKPRRTYDPIQEARTPAGAHVPMLMMRLARAEGERWASLRRALVKFGEDSGLFSDIRVKTHGKQMGDPFQLQVKVHSGSHANLMDVGYGVSQSLPILVELVAAELEKSPRARPAPSQFLLQQPEVHLHPRAQAELASFLVHSVTHRKHSFLVETHSDFILDRVRICVRRGEISPDDVSILFFEPRRNAVAVNNLTLDPEGNIRDAPAGYRDFFLRETDTLLGFVN